MEEIIRPLFWDADEKEIDFDAQAAYVIERVLEHGNDAQAAWLFGRYPSDTIQRVVEISRGLSAKSRQYWLVKFGLWNTQLSAPQRSAIWKR